MRRAARVDANHGAIVAGLAQAGCSVVSLAPIGQGVPDLLVGRGGANYLLEIKDADQPPSRQRLTRDQKEFFYLWRGQVRVVTTVDQALAAVGLGQPG